MKISNSDDKLPALLGRRAFLATAIGGAATASSFAQAPTRDFSRQDPVQYPDPDVVALDNRFQKYIVGNTVIRRLHFGTLWAEGPAWNGVGRYLVWSDIPNNVAMRWLEDDGRGTDLRNPFCHNNSNTLNSKGPRVA